MAERKQILTVAIVVATAITFYLSYIIAKPFLASVTWAMAIAVLLFPVYKQIEQFVRSKNLAAGLATFFVAVIVVAPVVSIANQVAQEIWGNVDYVRASIESGEWRAQIEKNRYAASAFHALEQQLNLRDAMQQAVNYIPGFVSSLVSGSAWIVLQLLIMFFALFFFFRDSRQFLSGVRRVIPLTTDETNKIFRRVNDTLYATVIGEVFLALVHGVLGGFIFWILGLPAPFLWGFVMAVLAFLPIVGTWMIWFPAAIFLMLQGEIVKGLVLIGWGAVALTLFTSFLFPILVGERMRLHTLLALIGILGGIITFGMVGVILGPLTIAVTISLFEIWKERMDETDAAGDEA